MSVEVEKVSVAAIAISVSLPLPSGAVPVAPVPPLVTVACGVIKPGFNVENGPVEKIPLVHRWVRNCQ